MGRNAGRPWALWEVEAREVRRAARAEPLAGFVYDLRAYGSYPESQGETLFEPVQETAPASPVVDTAVALASANKTLAAFGHACRNATEHNARLGKLAAEYVRQF